MQKGQRNKNLVGTLGHWVVGTPSASAKRSAEQKMAELKLAEQKFAEQKFGGDPQPLGGGDPLVQVQKGQQNKKWQN